MDSDVRRIGGSDTNCHSQLELGYDLEKLVGILDGNGFIMGFLEITRIQEVVS
jgi:hypothetical protein